MKLLFLVFEQPNFDTFYLLAKARRNSGSVQTIFYSPYYLPRTRDNEARSSELGAAYLTEVTALGGARDPVLLLGQTHSHLCTNAPRAIKQSIRTPFTRRLRTRLRSLVASVWVRLLLRTKTHQAIMRQWVSYYRQQLSQIERFLSHVAVDCVILPEDNPERPSCGWITIAHRFNIPSIVISYGAVTPEEAAETYFEDATHLITQSRLGRVFAFFFPWWIKNHRGRQLSRLPIVQALAAEAFAVALTDPWTLNSGNSDAMIVESDMSRSHWLNAKINPDRLYVAGNPWFDQLGSPDKSPQRQQLVHHDGLPSSRPLLLCAFPPNQYPHRAQAEFPSYDALVEFWFEVLESLSTLSVIISPHPTILEKDLEQLRRHRFAVIPGGVGPLISSCDLYLATVSSTIKWARAAGKPVINYDVYRYNYQDYAADPCILTTGSTSGFREIMRRMDTDASYRQRLLDESKDGLRWGKIDGCSTERIMALLTAVVKQNAHSAGNSVG